MYTCVCIHNLYACVDVGMIHVSVLCVRHPCSVYVCMHVCMDISFVCSYVCMHVCVLAIMFFNGNYGFCWQLWVFITSCGFSLPIMGFQGLLWIFIDDYGFLVTSTGFQWQLWVLIGNYGFSMAIMFFSLTLNMNEGDYFKFIIPQKTMDNEDIIDL